LSTARTTTMMVCTSFDTLVNVLSLVKRVAPEAFAPPGSYNSATRSFPVSLSLFLPSSRAIPASSFPPALRSRRVFQERQDNRTLRGVRPARLGIICKLRRKQRVFEPQE
jgi:hypothetical protein